MACTGLHRRKTPTFLLLAARCGASGQPRRHIANAPSSHCRRHRAWHAPREPAANGGRCAAPPHARLRTGVAAAAGFPDGGAHRDACCRGCAAAGGAAPRIPHSALSTLLILQTAPCKLAESHSTCQQLCTSFAPGSPPGISIGRSHAQVPQRPRFSMLRRAQSLPPQVHLLSLYDDGDSAVIFRLAHVYQVRAPAVD